MKYPIFEGKICYRDKCVEGKILIDTGSRKASKIWGESWMTH